LLKLDTPADYVDTLMEQWWYEKKEEPVKTWTKAEVFKFMKAEIITEERARAELQAMGYDEEHADKLVEFAEWIPPED